MCGIAGYIGESKEPETTYDIISNLFAATEVRGVDAAGFWGSNENGQIIYHKEPARSSIIVSGDMWKKVEKFNPDMILCHARLASAGDPFHNRNNHPFISSDKLLCLVHNGKITEFELLRKKYQVFSQCDSEILLRIIEASTGQTEYLARLAGIRDIFSLINSGHMSVALGEMLLSGERQLFLFRNKHRPLWVVDLRASLGQIFFCSTPEIWQQAIYQSNYKATKSQKLVEVPTDEVWSFSINNDSRHATDVKRYKVVHGTEVKEWAFDAILPIVEKKPPVKVISRLDEQDELPTKISKSVVEVHSDTKHDHTYFNEIENYRRHILHYMGEIVTQAHNMYMEGSMAEGRMRHLISSLSDIKSQLGNVLKSI
jgi:glucosamine 6-phosphate synthetase-like amidotransferase/phosphosugar isomerase protein